MFTVPGVFAPRSDTWLLSEVLNSYAGLEGAEVLELGTGSGAIAVGAARGGAAQVTAVDVSRRALCCAWINARLRGVRVEVVRGDLFAPVRERRFDFVVSNPPYLPALDVSEGDRLPTRGASRAWEGGRDGRQLLERICAQVAYHLKPRGVVLLMQSSVSDVYRTLAALEAGGLQADIVARRRGPLGPLLSERADALRERGLLGERDEEELLVVRGRRL